MITLSFNYIILYSLTGYKNQARNYLKSYLKIPSDT